MAAGLMTIVAAATIGVVAPRHEFLCRCSGVRPSLRIRPGRHDRAPAAVDSRPPGICGLGPSAASPDSCWFVLAVAATLIHPRRRRWPSNRRYRSPGAAHRRTGDTQRVDSGAAPCAPARSPPGRRDAPAAPATAESSAAWETFPGSGQKVAVIATGVTPHKRPGQGDRWRRLRPSGDGLDDCDAHGTPVAGIIAAEPATDDEFS